MQGRWSSLVAGPHHRAEPAGRLGWGLPRVRELSRVGKLPRISGSFRGLVPRGRATHPLSGAPRCGGAPCIEELLLEVDR